MLFDLFQKVFLPERVIFVPVQTLSAHGVDEIAHFFEIVQSMNVLGFCDDFESFAGLFMNDFFGFEDLHGADKFFLEEIDVEGLCVFEVEGQVDRVLFFLEFLDNLWSEDLGKFCLGLCMKWDSNQRGRRGLI